MFLHEAQCYHNRYKWCQYSCCPSALISQKSTWVVRVLVHHFRWRQELLRGEVPREVGLLNRVCLHSCTPACVQDYLISRPQYVRLNNVSDIILSQSSAPEGGVLSPHIYLLHSRLQANTSVSWSPNIVCPWTSQMAAARYIEEVEVERFSWSEDYQWAVGCYVQYIWVVTEIWPGVGEYKRCI